MADILLAPGVEIAFRTPSDRAHFFGYYDRCPFDAEDRRLLSHRVAFDGRDVTADDVAEVGFFDLGTGAFAQLGETRAFNWQQGSQLQWLGPDYGSRAIYNDRRDGRFVSVIVDAAGGAERVIPFPIYIAHPGGRFALGVNYERFHFFRPGYNYPGVVEPKWNVPLHPEDGIYRIDLESGAVELMIRTVDIAAIDPLPDFATAASWLEHFWWDPTGARFLFMHRWAMEGAHETRIYSANADGSDLRRFPDYRFYSHAGWRDAEEFSIWTRPRVRKDGLRRRLRAVVPLRRAVRAARRLRPRRPVAAAGGSAALGYAFVLFDDRTGTPRTLPTDLLPADGHCSWSHDQRIMLNDTYEDADSRRHLFLYDDAATSRRPLGSFHSHYNASGFRCDLHPRFSRQEDMISIDCATGDRRQQYVLRLTR